MCAVHEQHLFVGASLAATISVAPQLHPIFKNMAKHNNLTRFKDIN